MPKPKPIEATNDFVVKFANVNGSGSASANGLFAKVLLRMGVPVAARNIFPSNIQGLPTWYEVRVSGEGWLGRRGGVDLMVAMNPQTWDGDVTEIEPGGYLLYDNSKPLPASLSMAAAAVADVGSTSSPSRASLFSARTMPSSGIATVPPPVSRSARIISRNRKGDRIAVPSAIVGLKSPGTSVSTPALKLPKSTRPSCPVVSLEIYPTP